MGSKENILKVAEREFAEKGFHDASMRSIAGEVGITATALYRHFKDKEAIFDALVEPVLAKMDEAFQMIEDEEFDVMSNQGADAMWAREVNSSIKFVDMIWEYKDQMRLLLCHSQGTKYENFVHDIVTRIQESTLKFQEYEKNRGVEIREVNQKEMHVLLSAQYEAIMEIFRHDYTRKEAFHLVETVDNFFLPGWREFLGF
ncbi:MAG: TetR/AcrR family transcriptional regulator [Eubacterium sp.]|nr:TetR/AcrR family transcriptional regulator [Eubacterium sp.]